MEKNVLRIEKMLGNKLWHDDSSKRICTSANLADKPCLFCSDNFTPEELLEIASRDPLSYIVVNFNGIENDFSWMCNIYTCCDMDSVDDFRIAYPFIHSLCRLSKNKTENSKEIAYNNVSIQEVIEHLGSFNENMTAHEYITQNKVFFDNWKNPRKKIEIIGILNTLIYGAIKFGIDTYSFPNWNRLSGKTKKIAEVMYEFILTKSDINIDIVVEDEFEVQEVNAEDSVNSKAPKEEKDDWFEFANELVNKGLTDEYIKHNWKKIDNFIVWWEIVSEWKENFDAVYQVIDSIGLIDSLGSKARYCDTASKIVDYYIDNDDGDEESIVSRGVVRRGADEALYKAESLLLKSSLESIVGLEALIASFPNSDWAVIKRFIASFHDLRDENCKLRSLQTVDEKWRFVRDSMSYLKRSLEFPERGREMDEEETIDKRTIQIHNLIPHDIREKCDVALMDELEIEIEKLLGNITKILASMKIERIPWPSDKRCSDALSEKGYEKHNTKGKTTTVQNDHNKIYGELRPGIVIDGKIMQTPKFNVYVCED